MELLSRQINQNLKTELMNYCLCECPLLEHAEHYALHYNCLDDVPWSKVPLNLYNVSLFSSLAPKFVERYHTLHLLA